MLPNYVTFLGGEGRSSQNDIGLKGVKIEKITFSNTLIVIFMVVDICFKKINVFFRFGWF